MRQSDQDDLTLTGVGAYEVHETGEVERTDSTVNLLPEKTMVVPRRKLMRFVKTLVVILILGSVFVLVRILFFKDERKFSFPFFKSSTYSIGETVKLTLSDKTLTFFGTSSSSGSLRLVFDGAVIDTSPDLDSCAEILGNPSYSGHSGINPFDRSVCLKWKDTVLIVNDTQLSGSHCYKVNWATTSEISTPKNCFDFTGAHWYGGSLLSKQKWPVDDAEVSVNMQPYVSGPLSAVNGIHNRGFGPVLERMWISSAGFGIIADSQDPLHVSMNADDKHHLCLKSQLKGSKYLNSESKHYKLRLVYAVCIDRTTKLVHQQIIENFMTLPDSGPDKALMQDPAWSTVGINYNNLTEMQVLRLQVDIKTNKFPHSQVQIGGNYTRKKGDVEFNNARFPRGYQMVSEMREHGFNASTSILPFMEKDKDFLSFTDGVKNGIFVNFTKGLGLTWDGTQVELIDFMNPKACDWMSKYLAQFKAKVHVHAFQFDRGEALWLSTQPKTAVPWPYHCEYSRSYVRFARSQGDNSIVSIGCRSQEYGLMVDIGARSSTWGYELGLKSIIPSVLTLGIVGYPFVMVGPVGGIDYQAFDPKSNEFSDPAEELYIRWLQLSAFLPGLHISVGPWRYKKEVADMAHALFKRRSEQIFPLLKTATKEFLHTGAPMIRPLWWMAADDITAYEIDCEFLVSNKLLVAPVLEEGARSRDVYLPKVKDFQWQDDLRGSMYTGGQWLRAYKVGLYEVATFTLI